MAYRLSAQAESELNEIWSHVGSESGSGDIADRLLDSIGVHLRILGENPYIGRSRADLRPGFRSLPAGSYMLFYRVDGDDVLILRVLHGRRDIGSLLGQ